MMYENFDRPGINEVIFLEHCYLTYYFVNNLKFSLYRYVPKGLLEGSVSQICYLGLSFYFMS